MNYFPIFINLKHKNILIVGAGEVAFNKIKLLLRSGSIINIISQNISPDIQKLLDARKVKWISKEFNCSYLNKIFLVIAATNNIELNQKIFKSCNDHCIFVNVVDDQSRCSFIFPSIVDRSPIVVAISSGGKAPVLLRLLREKIETILPIRLGIVAEIAGNWRSIVKEKFTTLLERRRFWEKLFNSVFVQYIINGELKKAKKFLFKMICKSHFFNGEIILVGAGPGNCSLLTLRALQILQEADVVLYDRLVSSEVLDFIRRDAKCIYVGKSAGRVNISQDEIIKLLISLAKEGKKVVRLKGGDPFIFGRGGEELEAAKKEGINVQVVPGITAAIGISAYAGIPLTHRKYSQGVIFITGHKSKNGISNNWSILSDSSYTLAIYMGTLNALNISQKLIFHGRSKSTPIAVIGKGTTIKQTVTIGRLDELDKIVKFTVNPSLLIIGKVVLLHKKLEWFNTSSIFNDTRSFSSIVNLI